VCTASWGFSHASAIAALRNMPPAIRCKLYLVLCGRSWHWVRKIQTLPVQERRYMAQHGRALLSHLLGTCFPVGPPSQFRLHAPPSRLPELPLVASSCGEATVVAACVAPEAAEGQQTTRHRCMSLGLKAVAAGVCCCLVALGGPLCGCAPLLPFVANTGWMPTCWFWHWPAPRGTAPDVLAARTTARTGDGGRAGGGLPARRSGNCCETGDQEAVAEAADRVVPAGCGVDDAAGNAEMTGIEEAEAALTIFAPPLGRLLSSATPPHSLPAALMLALPPAETRARGSSCGVEVEAQSCRDGGTTEPAPLQSSW